LHLDVHVFVFIQLFCHVLLHLPFFDDCHYTIYVKSWETYAVQYDNSIYNQSIIPTAISFFSASKMSTTPFSHFVVRAYQKHKRGRKRKTAADTAVTMQQPEQFKGKNDKKKSSSSSVEISEDEDISQKQYYKRQEKHSKKKSSYPSEDEDISQKQYHKRQERHSKKKSSSPSEDEDAFLFGKSHKRQERRRKKKSFSSSSSVEICEDEEKQDISQKQRRQTRRRQVQDALTEEALKIKSMDHPVFVRHREVLHQHNSDCELDLGDETTPPHHPPEFLVKYELDSEKRPWVIIELLTLPKWHTGLHGFSLRLVISRRDDVCTEGLHENDCDGVISVVALKSSKQDQQAQKALRIQHALQINSCSVGAAIDCMAKHHAILRKPIRWTGTNQGGICLPGRPRPPPVDTLRVAVHDDGITMFGVRLPKACKCYRFRLDTGEEDGEQPKPFHFLSVDLRCSHCPCCEANDC
jgi:hypothetical protein